MLVQLLTIIVVFGNLQGKPVIIRNISDCSITDDGILHYQGKHSYTKFEHECLPWADLQTVYGEIINEPNFFNDLSVKAAKNYCRNPNMNINGPWCFVLDGDVMNMEECDVCQSLARRPTVPTDLEEFDDTTTTTVNNGFLHNLREEMRRYAAYIRQKFMAVMNHMGQKMRNLGSRISDRFNFLG